MTNLNSGSGLLNLNGLGVVGQSNPSLGDRNLNLQEWANTQSGPTANLNLGAGNLNLPTASPSPTPTPGPTPTPTPTPTAPTALPSPASWIDISQELGMDGLAQTSLSDRSTSGRTFSTSLLAAGTYRTNQRNGLPALRTTSALAGYVASSAPVIAVGSPFCLWFVGQSNGSDAIVWGNQVPNHQVRINYANPARNLFLFNGPNVTSDSLTVAESTAWNIYFFVRNAANETRFYLNGVPKHSTVSSSFTGALNLGRFLESYSAAFVGDFGEAGYNAADFTTAQLNSLGMYLSVKWAIAWTPIL